MKKTSAIVFSLFVCIMHTVGLGFAGLIPIYGQIADGRNITANALGIWDNPGSGSAWVGLGASVVGLVPLVGDAAKAGIRSAANAASDVGKAVVKNVDVKATTKMLGSNGTQVTSKTTWKGSNGRIDVENPAPGIRPGQVHYQDASGKKYIYDPVTQRFQGAPPSVNRLLDDPSFRQGIDKGMKYLGEL